jgi:hypothetical protein
MYSIRRRSIDRHFLFHQYHSLMPIRQSCHLHSCWFIVVNVLCLLTAKNYHLVYEALNNNGIVCFFCAEIMLEHMGRITTNYCSSHLLAMYNSDEAFIDHCIEVVCSS